MRKKELKELLSLRQHAINVSRLHGDCKDLRKEISSVENSLAVTGSTKTADDVQQELDELSTELWVSFFGLYLCCFTHWLLKAKHREGKAESSERSGAPD